MVERVLTQHFIDQAIDNDVHVIGVSSQAANSARVARFAGGAPMMRVKASRKPLGLSNPASSCASMTRSPLRIALNAEPSRRARAYSTNVMPKRF